MHLLAVSPFDLLLSHLYLILLLQLLFNWNSYNCGSGTNFWCLAIYIIFFLRLVISQLMRIASHDTQYVRLQAERESRRGELNEELNEEAGWKEEGNGGGGGGAGEAGCCEGV
jgi:hypothetical protein